MPPNKGLRLAGHPLHPMLVHLPIGLWSAALLWDVIGLWRGEPLWWAMSYWSIALGLGVALLAMTAGVADYATVPQGTPAYRYGAWHAAFMSGAALTFLGNLLLRGGTNPPAGSQAWAAVGLSAAGVLMLAIGGWLGGALVYRFGVGRD
jgi:uncharacterized membrane protein